MSGEGASPTKNVVENLVKNAVQTACIVAGVLAASNCLKIYHAALQKHKDQRARPFTGEKNEAIHDLSSTSATTDSSGLKKSNSESEMQKFLERENLMNEKLRGATKELASEDMKVNRHRVSVRVPATSANLGPGFDTIGMALDMWNELTVEYADKFSIECEGEGASDMPYDDSNLVCLGLRKAFEVAGKKVPTLKYTLKNRIPYARGLGSSSAAIVGGLIAGFVLAGHQVQAYGSEALLNLACEIEGHPDNVAPAIYGGIQLGIHAGDRWNTERVNVPPGLQCVCFIPHVIGKTSTARGVLSDQISRKDAVFNIGRVAWLINALATNNLNELKYGTQDALHQPQRGSKVYPHLNPLVEASLEAGACAAYLSGAGPTVMAFTSGAAGDIFTQRAKERVDKKVASTMLEVAAKYKVKGDVFITNAATHGASVISAEPPFSDGSLKYFGGV